MGHFFFLFFLYKWTLSSPNHSVALYVEKFVVDPLTKITKFTLLEAVELVEIVEVDLVVVEPLAPITATSSGQGGNQQLPKSGEVQVSFQSQATGKFWTALNDIIICAPLTSNLDV